MTETLLLDSYLKQLRLPTFVRQHRAVADDAARQQHDYEHYLLALAELEVAQRQQNLQRRCVQAAHFPVLKDLADFDFSCLTSPAKLTVLDLARGSLSGARRADHFARQSGPGENARRDRLGPRRLLTRPSRPVLFGCGSGQ